MGRMLGLIALSLLQDSCVDLPSPVIVKKEPVDPLLICKKEYGLQGPAPGEADTQTFPTAELINDSLSERAIVNEKSFIEYESFAEKENKEELESTVLEELIGKRELFREERQEDVNLSSSPTRLYEDSPEVLKESVGDATAAQHNNKSQDLREGRREDAFFKPTIVDIPDCFDSTVMPSKAQPLSSNILPTGGLPVKDRPSQPPLKRRLDQSTFQRFHSNNPQFISEFERYIQSTKED